MSNEFSQAEWDACIKVLQVLSRDPDKSLDTLTLKGLVTKLYKRAKKDQREVTTQAIQQQINATCGGRWDTCEGSGVCASG
ncbi:hypothetical protein [[Flexibacter] sp. ATCC 35208]|uniref:hypothetical protein n=1 Tax=[Flexibacter] sp. ATCC 35208 TaxID=1936242 RepID=UPI0009D03AF2|nr:hypothetical protein [[Flexibacter] sp. ATCC 35208]OMP77508.1 hypothetical protein BW716_19075 [[Flexibacter] sp. ATCC 35208]